MKCGVEGCMHIKRGGARPPSQSIQGVQVLHLVSRAAYIYTVCTANIKSLEQEG